MLASTKRELHKKRKENKSSKQVEKKKTYKNKKHLYCGFLIKINIVEDNPMNHHTKLSYNFPSGFTEENVQSVKYNSIMFMSFNKQ